MKQSLILLLVLFTLNKINAQEIEATTTGGKKIVLNIDNYTWRYANSQDGQKPCYTNHYATVYLHNNTKHDIYFYYSNITADGGTNIQYVMVKAGEHKPVEYLSTRTGKYEIKTNEYQWTVCNELYQNINKYGYYYYLKDIKGFDSGKFILEDCENKDIKIYD